jgi:hypothetical protein
MNLLSLSTITTATPITASASVKFSAPPRNLTVQGYFQYGSGSGTVDAWVQTSLDNGATWADIAQFHFTATPGRFAYNLNGRTPVLSQQFGTLTDGGLAANTALDGILGPRFRVKYSTTGTYGGATSLSVDISTDQSGSF